MQSLQKKGDKAARVRPWCGQKIDLNQHSVQSSGSHHFFFLRDRFSIIE